MNRESQKNDGETQRRPIDSMRRSERMSLRPMALQRTMRRRHVCTEASDLELEFVGLQSRAMKRQMERRREFEWRDANASIASASDATIFGLPWSALELPQRPSRPHWSARLSAP